jgi:hypothetical protein
MREAAERMKLLYFLSDWFTTFFGITRPTERARTQAAFFILALLLLAVAGMVAAAIIIHAAT